MPTTKTYSASANRAAAAVSRLLTNLPPGNILQVKPLPSGEFTVAVVQEEEKPKTKQELIAEKYAHLVGRGITMSQAAIDYQIPKNTVRNWVYQSRYVRVVDEDCYPRLVDEAEVAVCADIYKERQKIGLTGLPFFDDAGYVITERKREDLAEYRRRKREEKQSVSVKSGGPYEISRHQ